MARYNFSNYDKDQMRILNNSYKRKMRFMEICGETDTEEYTKTEKGVGVYDELLAGNISDREFRNRIKLI